MRLERWLFGALTVAALACGSDSDSGIRSSGSSAESDDDSDDSDDDTSSSAKDAGKAGKDAGKDAGRDAGRGGSSPLANAGEDTDDTDDGADETVCDSVSIEAKPNSPEILIVLDRSGSMIGAGQMPGAPMVNRWDPSASAVKKITSDLNEIVNFGLMLFPDPMGAPTAGAGIEILPGLTLPGLPGASCAPGKVNVPVKLKNASAIAMALDRGMPDPTSSTPTAATLEAAYGALTKDACADCPEVPKYVLLVTDGQPTCGMGNTMTTPADVEASNAAITKLKESGIGTYVIGYDTQADPALAAVMDGFAMLGGTNKHLAVDNEQDLITELTTITTALVSCEYKLNYDVENPALVRVVIDGNELVLGEGWNLEGRTITLEGACDTIKDGKVHAVKIRKDCEEQVFQ